MDSEFSKIGKQIDDAVQNAMNDKDYSKLNANIKNTVNSVIHETVGVTKSAAKAVNNALGPNQNDMNQSSWSGQGETHIRQSFGSNKMYASDKARQNVVIKNVMAKNVGTRKFWYVFALIMLYALVITFGISNIMSLFALVFSEFSVGSYLTFGVEVFVMLAGIGGIAFFTKQYKFLSNYKSYAKSFSAKDFWEMKKFAKVIGEELEVLTKRLNRYIDKGYYSEVYLSDDKTCLLIGQETYVNYKNSQIKHLEKKAELEREARLDPIIIEGRKYIKKIHDANELLPDEIISKKLDDLEDIITKIFAYLEQRPEKLGQIRKFMDYYLPTTMKLVDSYCDFEKQSLQGENVTETKKEILDVLDTINNAFIALFDELYKDDAIDISTDISVLKTMLKQEGLSDDSLGLN